MLKTEDHSQIKLSQSGNKSDKFITNNLKTKVNIENVNLYESKIFKNKNIDKSKEDQNKKKKVAQVIDSKNQNNCIEWQIRCNELQNALNLEHEQTAILELDLQNRQQRELEFKKIIDDLNDQLQNKQFLVENDPKKQQNIDELFKQINNNIQNSQQKTTKVLFNQERDIMRFFMNKINEIKKEFENERSEKTKKDQKYLEKENQLSAQLEWIKDIAQKINNENLQLQKKYGDLKSQYQTQESDREVLLKDLIMKKKKNAIIHTQYQQLIKIIEEQEKELKIKNQQTQAKNLKSSNIQKTDMSKSQQGFTQGLKSQVFNERICARYENTKAKLLNVQKNTQNRLNEIKKMYMQGIQGKSDLELIFRNIVEDYIDDQCQNEAKKKQFQFKKEDRFRVMEKLVSNEKVLSLIYDKIFHSEQKLQEQMVFSEC